MSIDYRAIGKRIKIARIRQDMTQEQLAERIPLSLSHMSNVETGNTKVSLPTIVAIANQLSVSVDELLCDNVVRSSHVFSKEVAGIFQDCSERETRVLVDILNSAKDSIRKNKVIE